MSTDGPRDQRLPFATIPLSQGLFAKVGWADAPKIRRYKWTATYNRNAYYAVRRDGDKRVYMHRVIAGAEDGQVVHHKNGDTLDNQRANLEVTTQKQNREYYQRSRRERQ